MLYIVGEGGMSAPTLESSAVRRYAMVPCSAVHWYLRALPTVAPQCYRNILQRTNLNVYLRAHNTFVVTERWFGAVPVLEDCLGWLLPC